METIAKKHRPARILLVEDNRGDVLLMQRALKQTKVESILTVAGSGEEALSMLAKEGDYIQFELPDLILLDVNLPKISGIEVLKTIKTNSNLKRIFTVMLSSSRAEQDVTASYNSHSNAYIVKPIQIEQFNETIQNLERFWFNLVLSPESGTNSTL